MVHVASGDGHLISVERCLGLTNLLHLSNDRYCGLALLSIVGKGPNREKGERPEIGRRLMQQLIELYEMVALNEDALHDTERLTILKARLAVRMFERAMQSFKTQFFETPDRTGSGADVRQARPAGSAAAQGGSEDLDARSEFSRDCVRK